MRSIVIPGGELRYAETGTGPPVLLLHGGALDHRMWDRQLSGLGQGFRLVRPDARGHGRSSTPTAPFRHCDDVAALIRNLDAGPASIVGLSMGGAAAIDTALEHPDLVRSVVVSGCGTGEPYFRDPWLIAIQAEWARAQESADVERWVEAFVRIACGPGRGLDDVEPEIVAYCRETATATVTTHARPDAGAPSFVAGSWDRLGEIDVPLLAVVGRDDSSDHHEMAARVADSVADGSLVTIAGTAHYPNMERPADFDAAVRAFLERTARRC